MKGEKGVKVKGEKRDKRGSVLYVVQVAINAALAYGKHHNCVDQDEYCTVSSEATTRARAAVMDVTDKLEEVNGLCEEKDKQLATLTNVTHSMKSKMQTLCGEIIRLRNVVLLADYKIGHKKARELLNCDKAIRALDVCRAVWFDD